MESAIFSSDFKLGILGGGQLGKMMLYTSRKWDIQTFVLERDKGAPAFQGCDTFIIGDLMSYDDVLNFGRRVDVLTIEIENVNVAALEQLVKEGIKVYPQPEVLKTIRNKASQKNFYQKNNLPTAPFTSYARPDEHVKRSYPFIWKIAEGGYDGKGVCVVKSPADLEKLPTSPCIYEDMVDFQLELSVIVARNASGEMMSYPVVEMEFHPEANQVEYVICPARIDSETAERARELALQISAAYKHTGLLAVEMFLTMEGELLVNEVAPRPHNSGHYSIEGSLTDQFEQHLRCVLDLPLGSTESVKPSVMINLAGEVGYHGKVKYDGIEKILKMPGVTPHIYGKKETRPYRKMGHVTVVADTVEQARDRAELVKQTIKVIA
ncbi:MAG: 5-(carboxyamino)imidazole ribonucleotide synthase [Nonlabens sp.]